MKIVIGVHHFPPTYKGGAEWRAYRTAAALQERGHDVQVICVERIDHDLRSGLTWEDTTYDGVNVRRLSFNLEAAPDLFRWEYDNPWIGDHLRSIFRQTRPDIFHLISGYMLTGQAILSAQELNIPTVVTLTDFWFLCRRISLWRSDGTLSTMPVDPVHCARCLGEEKRRYRWLGQIAPNLMDNYWHQQQEWVDRFALRQQFLRQALNRVQAIISPSQFLRSIHVQAGIPSEKIIFSRQGRDFPDLDPTLLQKSPHTVLRLGYSGQIAPHKGIHILAEALKLLPDAPISVHIYGEAEHFPRYTDQLKRLVRGDSRLKIMGTYLRQDVSRVFHNLDVLVVPSLWYENSPNVILEAFAHRTPVIASDLGGMAELVHHSQNGLLFRVGDAAALARQLRRLVEEPVLLAQLQAGIQPVKTVAQEIDELEAIYQRVVC